MGGWKLEAFKMGVYMAFPVGIFYYFNQPQYFEEWMIKIRRETYPHESQDHSQQLKDFIRQTRDEKDREMLKSLEECTKPT